MMAQYEAIKRNLSVHRSGGGVAYKREYPPAHYSLKVEGFSMLLGTKVEKYESGIFEAGGYKWSLCLYPTGDKKFDGEGHVSLYLVIEGTDQLAPGWDVNVNLRLFVLDQRRNTYLTMQDADGVVRRFHELKREWGFSRLISLDIFKEESNGYLVDDSCVFGAEVFVMKASSRWESLAMTKAPSAPHNTFTWTLDCYSKRVESFYHSNPFEIGGRSWKLAFYPNGDGEGHGKCVSVFLELVDAMDLPLNKKLYAEYKLRVLDQLNNNHSEYKATHWFSRLQDNWGYHFLSLEDLHKPAKGFIVKDTVKVQVEILLMSHFKVSPAEHISGYKFPFFGRLSFV